MRLRLAVAGSLAEVVYAAASVFLAHTLAVEAAGFWFDLITSVVLVGVGIGLLLSKSSSWGTDSGKVQRISPWVRTLALGFANPQLLIFWSANAGFLMSVGLFGDAYADVVAFSLGAGVGAFVLLSMVLRLGARLEQMLSPQLLKRINQGLGAFLIVVGVGRLSYMWVLPLF